VAPCGERDEGLGYRSDSRGRVFGNKICPVKLLPADVECLRMMAAECETVAAKLAAVIPPRSVSVQVSSVAAVNMAHADVGIASGKLFERMKSTAAKLAADSARFAVNEADSARELRGITEGM